MPGKSNEDSSLQRRHIWRREKKKEQEITDSKEQQAGTAQHTEVRVLCTSPQTNVNAWDLTTLFLPGQEMSISFRGAL